MTVTVCDVCARCAWARSRVQRQSVAVAQGDHRPFNINREIYPEYQVSHINQLDF